MAITARLRWSKCQQQLYKKQLFQIQLVAFIIRLIVKTVDIFACDLNT